MLPLFDVDKLSLEDESGVGGDDTTDAAGAIGELRVDSELALLANLHAEEALVPALDDLAGADSEVKGVATVEAGIELLAVDEGTRVVDIDLVT